jgi:uncharacterized membrane protein YhdT
MTWQFLAKDNPAMEGAFKVACVETPVVTGSRQMWLIRLILQDLPSSMSES